MKYTLIFIIVTFLLSCSSSVDEKKETIPEDDGNTSSKVTFNKDISPILNSNCGGCHGSAGPRTNYTTYSNAKFGIGNILSRVEASGSALMPKNGPKLRSETIDKLKQWKEDGLLQ